jgi:hypothetical protein
MIESNNKAARDDVAGHLFHDDGGRCGRGMAQDMSRTPGGFLCYCRNQKANIFESRISKRTLIGLSLSNRAP